VHQEEADQGILWFSPVSLGGGERLKVVATTSIVADVVDHIGGDRIDLTRLMPPGADPHSFEPTPQDVAAVSDAHIVFANGAGLEEFLEPLLESAGAEAKTLSLSQGIELHEFEDDGEGEHEHGVDPHTWTDPNNVRVWAQNIAQALSALDPAGAAAYESNANEYGAALEELNSWIEEQVALVPVAQRRMVTDHATFGYFAERYGFEMVGAIIPGYSTLSAPSAQELASLQDAIRDLGVQAVFVGNSVNPSLAQRVAEDSGVELVFLYTGSLSDSDGPASSYLEFMRYNVSQVVTALSAESP
jgi:ABC-type Zn uptake system ZnuABC Zn-binding protein ZnuA